MAAAVLCIAGTVLDSWTAQPASRYLLTEAVVDHHTLTLDHHEDLVSVDQARHDGHLYSDKAPYQPLLGVPFYQAFRAAGGDAFPLDKGRPSPNASFHWGRWWVGLWTAGAAGAALCVVLGRLIRQVRPEVATPAALALSLGTMLLPLSSAMFGHVLSALFLAGGWLLVRQPTPSQRTMLLAGVLLSASVGTEFPVAVPVAVITIAALASHCLRRTVFLVGGGALAAVPLLAYNWAAFDSPFSTAYQGHLTNFKGSGALGVYNLVWPQEDELWKAMAGDRGLFTLTPVCLVAVVMCVGMLRRRSPVRRDAVVALVILLVMWLISAGIDGYGGSSPGPRYLVPVLPFLAVPLAEAWHRRPKVCATAALIGVAPMVLATITVPLVDTGHTQAFRLWLDRAASGELAPSVPGELFGDWALVVLVILGLAAGVGAALLDRPIRRTESAGGTEGG
jgi:hypothetical protein